MTRSDRASASGFRILLIEDDRDIRETLRDILEGEGHTVEEAAQGKEGLDLLAGDRRFDLIVLDMMLPVMSGLEFLKKKVLTTSAAVPVLAISASAKEPDHKGIAEFLRKPVDLNQFLIAVAQHLEDAAQ